MKMIRYIILTAVLLTAYNSHAQLTLQLDSHALDSLSAGTYILNNNTPVNTPTADIVVTNTSNFSINGDSLSFGYSVTHGGLVQTYNSNTSDTSGVFFAGLPVQIPAGGSATFRIIVHVSSPVFVVGSSIVVIWPIIAGRPTIVDSARGVINAIDTITTGMDELGKNALKVYMSGSDLIIKSTENHFGDIRIYNAEGRLVMSEKISQNMRRPMNQYVPGIYIVEFILTDGSRKLYKVFNAPQQ